MAQLDLRDLPVIASIIPAVTEPAAAVDIVEEWGMQSFPASDPPANW